MKEMIYQTKVETDFANLEFDMIQREIDGPTLSLARHVPLEISTADCIDLLCRALRQIGEVSYQAVDGWQFVFRVRRGGRTTAAARLQMDSSRDRTAKSNPLQIKKTFIYFDVVGARPDIVTLNETIDQHLRKIELAIVTWYFRQEGRGMQTREVLLDSATEAKPEFYPWIAEGPEAYLSRYMQSSASVLFMEGKPGTGKTSLLRWMLWHLKLHAFLTYDVKIFGSDEMFVSFLFSDADVLIVEDADEMLTSREHHGNKLVSRFLGTSDGIVKLPLKKIVFTSNISDLAKVDHALLRPGRCFDVLHCRELTFAEAVKAAAAGGFAVPSEDRGYTLAELTNPKQGADFSRRTGF